MLTLALGASSVVFSWTGAAIVAGVVALVVGVRGRRELAAAPGALGGERMILAGSVLAVLGIAATIVLVLAAVLAVARR